MLGSKVKEKVTGFVGTVTAHCEHITGCVEMLVVANTLGLDGKPVEAWFDESRLTIHEVVSCENKITKLGGPRDSKPPARSHPKMDTNYKTFDGPRQST